jgi:hypothetical protein
MNLMVLSKKALFHWVGKLLIFLLCSLIFAPLGLFYLIVVIVVAAMQSPQDCEFGSTTKVASNANRQSCHCPVLDLSVSTKKENSSIGDPS